MQPMPPMPPSKGPGSSPRSSNTWIVVAIVAAVTVGAVAIGFLSTRDDGGPPKMRKSKRNEAELQLDRIKKAAKTYAIEYAGFPEGTTPLTPVEPCCSAGRGDAKCVPDFEQWQDPIWLQLDFQMDDPHYFQYAYEGTHERFVARAVGDLDCDGEEFTYVLEGTWHGGDPSFELIKPARPD